MDDSTSANSWMDVLQGQSRGMSEEAPIEEIARRYQATKNVGKRAECMEALEHPPRRLNRATIGAISERLIQDEENSKLLVRLARLLVNSSHQGTQQTYQKLLAHKSSAVVEAGARAAAVAGEDGDRALAAALEQVRKSDRTELIVELGRAQGPYGAKVLRDIVTSEGHTSDEQEAALYALARRCSGSATDAFRRALSSKRKTVRWAALMCLARDGDVSAVSDVSRVLAREVRRPSEALLVSPPLFALAYLARHAASAPQQIAEALREVQDHAGALQARNDQDWLAVLFPGGVVPSDPTELDRLRQRAEALVEDEVP